MSSAKLVSGYDSREDIWSFSTADNEIVLANIGDFGTEDATETAVADMVKSWNPDAIFTNGDNSQAGNDYSDDVDDDYGDYVDRNILIPCPGNHDWDDGSLSAYMAFFSGVVSNRYYYQKTLGPVTLFMCDGNLLTPDGYDPDSYQASWLAEAAAACRSPWKIAVLHRPPYSSGAVHGSTDASQWDFSDLDMVFSGHDHVYERLYTGGVYYIVNGLGGSTPYSFGDALSASQVQYNALNGAGKLVASPTKLVWRFYSYDGVQQDSLTLEN